METMANVAVELTRIPRAYTLLAPILIAIQPPKHIGILIRDVHDIFYENEQSLIYVPGTNVIVYPSQ